MGESLQEQWNESLPKKWEFVTNMSELLRKQWQFARMVHALMGYAYSQGYELTFGDAYRDPRVPYGHPESLHKMRLAIDFNLFKDGIWQKKTEEWTELGEYFEAIGGSWGGRFEDGNHLSLTHEGRR